MKAASQHGTSITALQRNRREQQLYSGLLGLVAICSSAHQQLYLEKEQARVKTNQVSVQMESNWLTQ